MADVLDQLSQAIGRPVKPLERKQTPAIAEAKPDEDKPAMTSDKPATLESVLGRKIQPVKLQPLASARWNMYSTARQNGFTPDIAAKTAMSEASVMTADPSNWRKIVSAVKNTRPTGGETFSQIGEQAGNILHRLWANPLAISDEDWEKGQKQIDDYFNKQAGTGAFGRFTAGADAGLVKFGAEMTSPGQLALAVGTFGESALVRAGAKLGIPGVEVAAKTLAKLMQLQFASQMTEGAAAGVENTYKSAVRGDWQSAGQSAIDGLVSGLMAKGLASHELANEKVRGDLEKTAREQFGAPTGNPVTAAITSRFDQLDPYRQGQVIHETVQKNADYQSLIAGVDAKNDKERKKTQQRASDYHDRAIGQAFDPNIARRTVQKLDQSMNRRARMDQKTKVDDAQEAARQHYLRQVVSTLRTATERGAALAEAQRQEDEAARQEGREARPQRQAAEREKRAVTLTNAKQVEDARTAAATTRADADRQQAETKTGPSRPVDAQVADDGHVSYPATYYGETNNFGVAGDADALGVYRETPRGTQYLDKSGVYTEQPQDIYMAPDHETADTVAKLSSLRHTAESEGNAQEESLLSKLQQEVVSGEKTASEARKEAGIADQIELPTEVDALRAGDLKGPLADKSAAEFLSDLQDQAGDLLSSGEKEMLQEQAGVIVRAETENNLHHVQRSGDYVTSKRDVRWTLDSQGMMHPDDGGTPFPLMKNGHYSSQAIKLGQSGKVGWGGRTREQRRADTARQRAIQARLDTLTDQQNEQLRQAQHQLGLELVPEDLPSERQVEKQERAKKFGPPDEQTAETRKAAKDISQLVRDALEKTGAAEVVTAIAKENGVDVEEVLRQNLARDDSPEGQAASLQVGDKITDPFRKNSPWVVEEAKSGGLQLRSGNANPLPLDRMNPSKRVLDLIRGGSLEQERPITDQDVTHVAFESPHVIYRDAMAEEVRAIQSGAEQVPEPKSVAQAEAQATAAERRTDAAVSKATDTQADAIEPPAGTTVEQADRKVDEATRDRETAEEAYSQETAAKSKTVPKDPFPPRASVSIGLRGNAGVIKQNGRELPMHYEMVPLESLEPSHVWQGNVLVINPRYTPELQPRTISEEESLENAMRAQQHFTDENGLSTGYDFREYGDKTINGAMGPALIEPGGQIVGGNTRIAIMLKHLEVLRQIQDPIEREVALSLFRDQMRNLARGTGIEPPLDEANNVVVRVLDKPIETLRDAADLGRLFNKSISVQMTEAAKGISYSKALTDENLTVLGRLIDEHDGLGAAMAANPEYFSKLVTNNFGIVSSEYANWFESNRDKGLVLNDAGKSQFSKALLGTIFKDTSVLNRIEGTVPYRAIERALPHLLKMRAIPDRDITSKVIDAVTASADTQNTDKSLSLSNDAWAATYRPDQVEFLGMETDRPPEPDRMVEALWRGMHGSSVSAPRTFSDRIKNWIKGESTTEDSMFAVHETPAETFSKVFAKELREVGFSRNDKVTEISQPEFDSLLRNQELSKQAREEAKRAGEGKPPKPAPKPVEAKRKGGLTPPPIEAPKPVTPEATIAEAKADKGFVTPDELKTFLSDHESTREHVPEIMRTAQMMAEYVFDADPPDGMDRKEALAWILKERVARLEVGGKGRGSYSDPLVEKGIGTGILKLAKAADETTFIHEFAHVIFPMLSEEDHRNLNTILHEKIPQWDVNTPLRGEAYRGLSEKFAGALEKFLRDQNPRGFSAEVKQVLAKVKEIFRKAYMRFRGDPLNNFQLTPEAKGIFTSMFHIEDLDISDSWHDEVKKARAEAKRMTRPEESAHPIVKIAQETGAAGIRKAFAGKVEDSVGDRVDQKKPTIVLYYPNADAALPAWAEVGTEGSKIQNAELIAAEDGSYGIRINTASKVPSDVLFQEVPRKHPGIELEELKKKLASTPEAATVVRKLYQLRIQNLENEIRAKYGAEERKPVETKEAAKAALQEKKNVPTGKQAVPDVRRLPERDPGSVGQRGVREIAKSALLGGKDDATLRGPGGPVPGTRSLTGVKPVNLQPIAERGEPVGILAGDKFDAKEWVDGLKKAGLPENTPPPTVTLSRETAQQLKYAGQKQIVQAALSALEQGDGFVVASATGSGKTYTGAGIIKEFQNENPGAKILYITKNRSLLDGDRKKSFKAVGKNSFGFDVQSDVPRGTAKAGVYGTTYQRLLSNDVYKNNDWDLVVADESGEMRNWFRNENQQGKVGMEVIDKAKKAVYVSATPFHSPAEYGYAKKLDLWPKNGFDKWIADNFAHEKIGDKIVAKLDPGKQAKLRQQMIERGQFVSQMISYDGFTTHFGVVPIGDDTRIALNRIHEGVARAKQHLIEAGKKGLADRLSAFEATYTKAYLERSRVPQAIELAKKGMEQGWHPLIFSETTSEDLFRRQEDGEPGTYRKLDEEMGGELSRIIPPFPNVYADLKAAFGDRIADFSGMDNTDAAREEAKQDYLSGRAQALYTTYAAGGIGVSLHDEDGDKPRLAIFLGPPYSGVLLEQAMGRPWRFGVKSNVISVMLATDSEPDIALMATKVGPRMRALRATVLGERDSLGTVMGSYSDEQRTREQQDMLAYDQGNEVKVDAQSFQRRDKRNVRIDNWSGINFPHADTAKHKGMQIKTAGKDGDWATMYQPKNRFNRPPMSIGEMAAQRKLNDVAEAIAKGTGLPPGDPMADADPSTRETIAGGAAATGAVAIDSPVERDKTNASRMAAENVYKPGWRKEDDGVFRNVSDYIVPDPSEKREPDMEEEAKVDYHLPGIFSSEVMIKSLARQAGTPEVGRELVRMQRDFVQIIQKHKADYSYELERIANKHKIDLTDDKQREEMWDVVRGKVVSKDANINAAAEEVADLNEIALADMGSAGVKGKKPNGEDFEYSKMQPDRNYMPLVVDYDAVLEDPLTKETATLKEIMGKTFSQAKRLRMVEKMAAEKGVSPERVIDDLKRHKRNGPPVLGNVQRTREIDFPIYKKDLQTLMRYYDQVARAIATEKVFGGDLEKLRNTVAKIPNEKARETILDSFQQNFRRQDWGTFYGKAYNKMAGFEVLTKMNFSALKIPFHLGLAPLGLGGDVRPLSKATIRMMFGAKGVKEWAAAAGTIIDQTNPLLLMNEEANFSLAHWVLKKEGFNAAYNLGRTIVGESAHVYMEQYAIDNLKSHEAETRELLKNRLLITDQEIDEAMIRGKFSIDAIHKGMRAYTNLTMFTEHNPMQMPPWARMDTSTSIPQSNFNRIARASYVLQTFAVKAHSLIKETVVDELRKGNIKPLVYMAIAFPALGQMMRGLSAAIPSGVHRGVEQATGQQHKKDAWDRYIDQFKGLYGDHPLITGLKVYGDGMFAQAALDIMKMFVDPFMDVLNGENQKARSEFTYLGNDAVEEVLGPVLSTLFWHTLLFGVSEGIALTSKHPDEASAKAFKRWLGGELPITRLVPGMETPSKKPASSGRMTAPPF